MKNILFFFCLCLGLILLDSCSANRDNAQSQPQSEPQQTQQSQESTFNSIIQEGGDSVTLLGLKNKLLTSVDTVIIPNLKGNFHTALQTGGDPEFYHWSDFTEVYEKISTNATLSNVQRLNSYVLNDSAFLKKVITLTNARPQTPDEFAATVISLVNQQRNGEVGNLLTNGQGGNIFFIEISTGKYLVVDVSWFWDDKKWHLSVYRPGFVWTPGFRVFLNNQHS